MYPDTDIKINEEITEHSGSLKSNFNNMGLMHSVLENDKNTIQKGKLISNAINQGMGGFTPDLMFKNLVEDYSLSRSLYGEALIRRISGYEPEYIEKNKHIPEFKKKLKQNIDRTVEDLKKEGYIDDNGISDKGIEIAALTMYMEELDELNPEGNFGSITKKCGTSGDKEEIVPYKNQRYKSIAIRKSLNIATRRKHKKITKKDLRAFREKSKGRIYLVYCIDTSGSMKGGKLAQCKKAGIALAYRANERRDKIGLIVFNHKVIEKIEPTDDFVKLLKTITRANASGETDIAETIKQASLAIPKKDATKHIILITDAIPTRGDEPEKKTLQAVSQASSEGITISVVGIQLDDTGEGIAKKIVGIGGGRLYRAKDLNDIDKLVLEDYSELR